MSLESRFWSKVRKLGPAPRARDLLAVIAESLEAA